MNFRKIFSARFFPGQTPGGPPITALKYLKNIGFAHNLEQKKGQKKGGQFQKKFSAPAAWMKNTLNFFLCVG